MVVLSACEDRASIDGALNAGARAFIVKTVNPTDLAAVLRQTWGSGMVFHASSNPRPVVGRTTATTEPETPVLTERERTILETAEISEKLWVSEHTVKFHLTNIYRKLEVQNRASAVRWALENRLIAV